MGVSSHQSEKKQTHDLFAIKGVVATGSTHPCTNLLDHLLVEVTQLEGGKGLE